MHRVPEDLDLPSAFEIQYASYWKERWNDLKKALIEPTSNFVEFAATKPGSIHEPYFLDSASLFPVIALDIQAGMSVLDLCAAPGGKSIALSRIAAGLSQQDSATQKLRELVHTLLPRSASPTGIAGTERALEAGSKAELAKNHLKILANERSAARRIRLHSSLQTYAASQADWSVAARDGLRFGRAEPERWDRVLADVPCSSERHLLQKPALFDSWTPRRTERNMLAAAALGLSAFDSLRTGGRMVYSTCSVSPVENEQAIAKMLRKRSAARLIFFEQDTEPLEKTELGYYILPDRANGRGPIFFAIIEKLENRL